MRPIDIKFEPWPGRQLSECRADLAINWQIEALNVFGDREVDSVLADEPSFEEAFLKTVPRIPIDWHRLMRYQSRPRFKVSRVIISMPSQLP